jgi:hypothetical protein
MALISHTLRVAFVDLHTLPILEQLAEEWYLAGAEVPELPRMGRFNVDEILGADYFFC